MPKKESKDKIIAKVTEYLDKYQNIMVTEVKDLPACNVHRIRKDLRSINAEVLCGKTVKNYF
jgi:ribosomal protein L10